MPAVLTRALVHPGRLLSHSGEIHAKKQLGDRYVRNGTGTKVYDIKMSYMPTGSTPARLTVAAARGDTSGRKRQRIGSLRVVCDHLL
ncbi:MAG TPA: hypothetical protein VJN19_01750 [Propionibacteriaceae bacterium]|nr:hypothetical protein [Propionibacteriaceae bacterium]